MSFDWSATAAWVQAVGSVAAIGVAIWVPYNMDRKARDRQLEVERRRQVRTQVALLPTLYALRSQTADFLDEHSGTSSLFGIERDAADFDSNFVSAVPTFIEILSVAAELGDLSEPLAKLSMLIFKVSDDLNLNTKLQRDGYRAAWLNHKDTFIASAQSIHDLADMIIGRVELLKC